MLESYNNKRAFITGHTGFKGSWLCKVLEFLNCETYGFSLSPITNPSHFELLSPTTNSTIGNINDVPKLKQAIQNSQADVLFHMAAQPLVRESYINPVNTYQTNVMGTLNVLEAIRSCPSIKAVVIITTDKVYENKEQDAPYLETDELGGYDVYSSSKACSEILVRSYKRSFINKEESSVSIATARAGNVIGGGDWSSDRLIPDIMKAASLNKVVSIRSPQAIRPWQHVLDCLNGYLILGEYLLNGKTEFANAWNFAPNNGESLTVEEVVNLCQQTWDNIKIEFESPDSTFHEAQVLKLDNSKAVTHLNWKPVFNMETAIEKTVNWYKAFYNQKEVITANQIKDFF